MNVVLCVVAKHENIYINEWCRYYLNLGFSHIYIYDNNEPDYPDVADAIDVSIKDKISIIRYTPNDTFLNAMQVNAFQNFYDTYGQTFDWCAFFDIDEFLVGIDNVNEFLAKNRFKNTQQIKILWRLYGDGEMITRDLSKSVHESFKDTEPVKEIKNSFTYNYYHNWIDCCKCFLAGKQDNIKIANVHFATTTDDKPLKTKFPNGEICICQNFCNFPSNLYHSDVFINHYITKTISEFLDYKYLGLPVFTDKPTKVNLNYFWAFNTKTPEKEAYIAEYLKNKNIV